MRSSVEFENEYVRIELKGGIMCAFFKTELLTKTIAVEGVKARIKLSAGMSYPFFVNLYNVRSTTKDAREFLSTPEANVNIVAAAMLINSPVQRIMGNFFLAVNKPQIPLKLFTSTENAIEWLQQYNRP